MWRHTTSATATRASHTSVEKNHGNMADSRGCYAGGHLWARMLQSLLPLKLETMFILINISNSIAAFYHITRWGCTIKYYLLFKIIYIYSVINKTYIVLPAFIDKHYPACNCMFLVPERGNIFVPHRVGFNNDNGVLYSLFVSRNLVHKKHVTTYRATLCSRSIVLVVTSHLTDEAFHKHALAHG